MARRRPDVASIDDRRRAYLNGLSPIARKLLLQVRALVKKIEPLAVEHFSYGIPGFRIGDRPLVWYAGFARHFSLFPIGVNIRRTHAAALAGYETSTGTVRFPLDEGVPATLVKSLVKARVAEARAEAAGGQAKAPDRTKASRRAGARKR